MNGFKARFIPQAGELAPLPRTARKRYHGCMQPFKAYRLLFFISTFGSLPLPALAALPILGNIKADHFGYRSTDSKIAYFTADPGGSFEIRDAGSNALAYSASSVIDAGLDSAVPQISGDHVWQGDFSALTTPGHYVVSSPSLGEQSYDFFISDTRYQAPMQAALKSFYYARCGSPKDAAHGGAWTDAACHAGDGTLSPLCSTSNHYGAINYGTLDLHGGWHDAGDFEKKIGYSVNCGYTATGDNGDTLWYLLSAYENNPGAFSDSQSNIPETGNGVPDILDEAKYELDFYLRMQMPDGHVLAGVHTDNLGGQTSPPSTDPVHRDYLPPAYESEAVFCAMTAHAARVFAGVPGLAAYAATLKAAALLTFNSWVKISPDTDPYDLSYTHYKDMKFWAASEVYRLDSSQAAALTIVDNYASWAGFSLGAIYVIWGVTNYIQSPGATLAVVNAMKADLGSLVNAIFAADDSYHSGIDSWRYTWNSNWNKAEIGIQLATAAQLNACGAHTPAQCLAHAEDFLHYLNGANPLNMCYMTNAASLGAGHGVWHYFNTWFGQYISAYSKSNFIGKPASVTDPLYPYTSGADNYGISDNDVSNYGPPPGFVPGGPTYQYKDNGGTAIPPLQSAGINRPYAKAYRDWNFVNASTQPWIVNEGGIYDTSSYLALAALFAGTLPATPTPSVSPTPTPSFTESPVFSPTQTPTITPTASITESFSPSPSATLTPTPPPSFCPSTLIDDFEDPSRDGVAPARTCLFGGSWSTTTSLATISASYGAAGAHGSVRAASLSGNVSSSSGYAIWYGNLKSPLTPVNAAAAGATGIQLWVKGDGRSYRIMLMTQAVTDFDQYGIDTVFGASWTLVTIPFTSLSRAGWGSQTGLPAHPSGSDITGLQFTTPGGMSGAFAFSADEIAFYCPLPSPTASQTKSPSPSPSPATATPSSTITPPWTATPSPIASPAAEDGPLKIRSAIPFPNPNPAAVLVDLGGHCDKSELRIYSPGMSLLAIQSGGALSAGRHSLALDPDWLRGAHSGLYIGILKAWRDGQTVEHQMLKIMILK